MDRGDLGSGGESDRVDQPQQAIEEGRIAAHQALNLPPVEGRLVDGGEQGQVVEHVGGNLVAREHDRLAEEESLEEVEVVAGGDVELFLGLHLFSDEPCGGPLEGDVAQGLSAGSGVGDAEVDLDVVG